MTQDRVRVEPLRASFAFSGGDVLEAVGPFVNLTVDPDDLLRVLDNRVVVCQRDQANSVRVEAHSLVQVLLRGAEAHAVLVLVVAVANAEEFRVEQRRVDRLQDAWRRFRHGVEKSLTAIQGIVLVLGV